MNDTARRYDRLKSLLWGISLVAGIATLGLGLLVVVGWHFGNRTLVQVAPALVPMQYNTALGFILCGASLLLLAFRRRKAAAAVGGLAAVIGGLTLSQYIGRFDLGIDELFMRHDITVATSTPGRMAPNTAICFTLAGVWATLLVIGRSAARRSLVQVILASVTVGLAAVALSGYYMQLETAYGWGNLTRMAVHTSLGFITLSVAQLCLVWRHDIRAKVLVPLWIPLPLAITILTATLCFSQAVAAEGVRLQLEYQDFSSLTHLATLVLVVGTMLAFAMAIAAYLAQKEGRRAGEIAEANQALQMEIKTRVRAERELQAHRENLELLVSERTRDLDQARHEAENANRAKSDFLSHMSHELRTPLNGILGYAQILQRDSQIHTTQRAHLRAIISCGDHLLSLINDVLDLSKIEAGRLEVDEAPLDFQQLIQGVTDVVRAKAVRKDLGFEVQISDEVPRAIISDAAKLRQIMINLLGNAVKFTDNGCVTLRVAEAPRGSLRIEVEDTGVGIVADELEEIFDPFKQVEAGKAAGGTGLGLAITKRLAESLGGEVAVTSEPAKGSVFTITLPLVEAEEDASLSLPDESGIVQRHEIISDGQDWTILVADDRDTNRDVLQGLLEGAGFKTLIASDGDEALDLLRANPDVNLAPMDVRMPRLSGLEALRLIREDEKLRDLKVIAVTASVFPEFRARAIKAGFDDFLGKPFRVDELMGILSKHLSVEFSAQPLDAPASGVLAAMHQSECTAGISDELAERLRRALRIKNLTALKAVAEELSGDSATAALGGEIRRLAGAFDFAGLADLLEKLEQMHGSE